MLASLHALSHAVHGSLSYRRETTDSATTAADALELGCGVCQDFTHIFLACARHIGVPARYVAGYVFDGDIDGGDGSKDDEELGEIDPSDVGQSHGWAEAFVDGLGWVGFDPTRKMCVTDRYVRLSWGVDAFDSAPLRGVAQLSGAIGMNVEVQVDEAPVQAGTQSQSQSQQ
jgi:transglutaminase-like putative cysteine protease